MADYASFLYNAFGGLADARNQRQQTDRSNMENDRDYAAKLDQTQYSRGIDDRNYAHTLDREKVGDSQWQQDFGANQDYRNRTLGLQERAANRKDVQPLVRAGDGTLFDPNNREWLTAPKSSGAAQGKPPAGYRWSEDGSQLEPIPGGPATTLSADVAGRVGLANSFLGQEPGIEQQVRNGAVTGAVDRFKAGNVGSSDQAGIYRKIQSGVDALTRMLTGAGMNSTEAASYAQRYLPSYTDDANSAADKLSQLSRELQSAGQSITRGKGGPTMGAEPPAGAQPAQQPQAGGIIDKARAAIQAGADPAAVAERLRQAGVDPSGL